MEHLQIEQFGGDSFPPSWLQPQNLPALKSMYLVKCDGFERIVLPRATPEADALISSFDGVLSGSVGADGSQQASTNNYACLPFTSLTLLVLLSCRKLKNLDQCLSPEYFPSIQSIQLLFFERLESIPVDKFGGFVCLHDLKIMHCRSLVCPREMVLPKSLERLYIEHSGKLDRSLKPTCLENLASITLLYLKGCPGVESILLNSINTNNLKALVLRDCLELSSIGGSQVLSSIQHVDINGCPKLTEVQQQPLVKRGLRRSELSDIQDFNNHP